MERPICQLDYFQRGVSQSIVHGLASRGAAHLRRVADVPFARLDWTTRNRSVKRLFLEHALMVSDIMVALELACRRRSDLRLLVEHEIPLPEATRTLRDPFRWTVTVSGKGKLGVIPDRVFALEFTATHERILCFLEADRGTMRTQQGQCEFHHPKTPHIRGHMEGRHSRGPIRHLTSSRSHRHVERKPVRIHPHRSL